MLELKFTSEQIRRVFADLSITRLQRYALPALGALMFVLEGAHDGRVTKSLALDAHGKTLGGRVVDLELTASEPDGRRPFLKTAGSDKAIVGSRAQKPPGGGKVYFWAR